MIANSDTLVTLCERTAERLRGVHEAVLETENSAPHMPKDTVLALAAMVFGVRNGKVVVTSLRATVDIDDEDFAQMLEDLAKGIRQDGMEIVTPFGGGSDANDQPQA